MKTISSYASVAALVVAFLASPVLADLSPMALAPIGDPHFTESITQSAFAPATDVSAYVGIRVVTPADAFIEGVSGLGATVTGTEQFNSNSRLIEAWYANTPSLVVSATLELESLLGNPAAQANPASYDGVAIEWSLADTNGNITGSRTWTVNEAGGWNVSDLDLGSAFWNGGSMIAAPAPGAALLGMIGLGLVGWIKNRLN